MKKMIPLLFAIVLSVLAMLTALPASAESGYYAVLYDYDNSLTDSEEQQLLGILNETAYNNAMYVGVVITNDKDGKSSMRYADDCYDELFGINTDGILLLLDNEGQDDYISTSGAALDLYYSDYAVEKIFDDFYTPLHKGDLYGTITSFANSCETRKYLEGTSYNLEVYDEDEYIKRIVIRAAFALGGAIVIFLSAIATVKVRYNGPKSAQTDIYNDTERLYYRQETDFFVKEYTTSVSTSSSSSGGSHGSRHSSHRSSGGGRHGGGGRHR